MNQAEISWQKSSELGSGSQGCACSFKCSGFPAVTGEQQNDKADKDLIYPGVKLDTNMWKTHGEPIGE